MKRIPAYWHKWGVTGLKLYFQKKNVFSPYICFNLPELNETIYLRHDTSDVKTFDKIFLDEEYGMALDHPPKVIIDAGANIGAASIYFANKYPEARIISIEPEKSNFQMLLKNTAPYKNIVCLEKALWHTNEPLTIENRGVNKESFEVRQQDDHCEKDAVQSTTVNDLIREFDLPAIDILKIDIEGAEKEVFSNHLAWLEKVGLIFIELHDRKNPGCRESFFKAVNPHAENVSQKGETIVAVIRRPG